jgi:hypothetical protein
MEIEVAAKLIHKGVANHANESWADLGAGNGLFTKALSALLPSGSIIYAIDKNSVVESISIPAEVTLKKIQQDFTNPTTINVPLLDGILIANALHYVKEKIPFLLAWKKKLKSTGIFIVVEYDLDKGNQWVPYPLSFHRLSEMKEELDASEIILIGKEESLYHRQGMYAATIAFRTTN